MSTGYPRFIHKSIKDFARDIVVAHGQLEYQAWLFSTHLAASRCLQFIKSHAPYHVATHLNTVQLALDASKHASELLRQLSPRVSAVIFTQEAYNLAKQYWQHTGDDASSCRAEFCHRLFKDGVLVPLIDSRSVLETPAQVMRGPKRYQRPASREMGSTQASRKKFLSTNQTEDHQDSNCFLEERFGRNLNISLVEQARSAICRRIAGSLSRKSHLHETLLYHHRSSAPGANVRQAKTTFIYFQRA